MALGEVRDKAENASAGLEDQPDNSDLLYHPFNFMGH